MKYQMFINGQWTDAVSGEYYEDYNPYTGEVFAEVANGGAEDAKLAIDAAAAAFPAWKDTPAVEKRKLLIKAAEILESRSNEFAAVIRDETGGTLPLCFAQLRDAPEFLREAASQVHDVHGQIFPSESPDTVNMMWRQPMGVVGCISPWNAALLLGMRAIVFPLAYGNTVVFKTSADSSVVGVMITQVMEEAGFPAGVINLVTNGPGRSGEIGDVLTSDDRVRCITFTGSTSAGQHLAVQCAEHFTRFCSELGGSCPLIVLNDADVDYAVGAAAFGRFIHQGQICMGTKRVVVEEGIADEFLEKMTAKVKSYGYGNPAEPTTIVGPLINQTQMDILVDQVETARKQGAKILCGGKIAEGLVYEPTVLVMTEDMDISQQEVFGPVANIIIAKDADDAVRIANGTQFGLSSAVITKDFIKAWDIAEQLEAGCCHINDTTMGDNVHAPLGGMKASGSGKNGFMAINEFTEVRWVTIQKKPAQYPF